MKITALMLALIGLVPAWGAQAVRETTPQQQLMTTCRYEADARELQGNDRNRFIAACLATGRKREQEILAQCRLEARSIPALQRRAFMNDCSRR